MCIHHSKPQIKRKYIFQPNDAKEWEHTPPPPAWSQIKKYLYLNVFKYFSKVFVFDTYMRYLNTLGKYLKIQILFKSVFTDLIATNLALTCLPRHKATCTGIGSIFNPLAGKFSGHTRQKPKRHEKSRSMYTLLIGQNNSDQSEPCRYDLKTTWWKHTTRWQTCIVTVMAVKLYKWLK